MTNPILTAELDLADYYPRVCRFFAARGCGHVAEDLTSEVTIRVLAAIRRGEPIQHVGAYSLGTARRVLLEHFREKGRDPEPFPEGWEPPAPEPEESDQDQVALLQACLGTLGKQEQEIVAEYYGDGKNKTNRARLAERLGVSLNAIHVKACRLRTQVRRCLETQVRLHGR